MKLLVLFILSLDAASSFGGKSSTCPKDDETSLLQLTLNANSRKAKRDARWTPWKKLLAKYRKDAVVQWQQDMETRSKDRDMEYRKDAVQRPGDGDGSRIWPMESVSANGQKGDGNGVIAITDKPQSDPRKYQGAVLENGMHVLNIQDSGSINSAMAMGVMSGSYNNPKELPGLAHFCEHMLFLGSNKFPEASGFDSFMSKHGGTDNAYTDVELTNYYFQASTEAATELMPRFADWFTEPLFNATYVNKEVHAIDSENAKNVQDPSWRIQDTINHLANPESPVSVFHTGNVRTLITDPKKHGIDTVAALHKYFHEHYCASKMRLVTFGPTSVSEQFAAVKAAFSHIPAGSESCRKPQSFAQPPAWPADRLGKWVNILGTSPHSTMMLVFPMFDLRQYYASEPSSYLEYVFEYGALNSLTWVLESQLGLASGLDFSCDSDSANGRCTLAVSFTDSGRQHKDVVLDVLFSYIAALRKAGVNKKLYESLKDMSKLNWEWSGNSGPAATARSYAAAMPNIPFSDLVWAGGRIDVVNESLVSAILEKLTPDNMLVVSVDPGPATTLFKGKKVHSLEHYGVQYSVQPLDTVLPGRPDKWHGWLSGRIPIEEIHAEINNTKRLSLDNLPLLKTFPVIPGPIIGVPTKLSLTNMHAKSLSGKPGVSLTEALYGPDPRHLLHKQPRSHEMWFRRGWVTLSPKAKVSITLRRVRQKDEPEPSARETVEYTLYATLLSKHMVPRLYDLTRTGVDFSISTSSDGLSFSFGGFTTKKMWEMVKLMIQEYKKFVSADSELTPVDRFNRAKLEYSQSIQDFTDMPTTYALADRTLLVQRASHSREELLDALGHVTLPSALSTGNNVISAKPLILTSLAMGNINQQGAVAAVNAVEFEIPGVKHGLTAGNTASGDVERVTPIVNPSSPVELRKKNPRVGDPNDVVVVSMIHGVATLQDKVVLGIIGNILQSVAYQKLRTEEQLGYVVNAGTLLLSNVLVVSCVVQGNKLGADPMEAAVESVYHKHFPEKLAQLTNEDFQSYKDSYRQSLLVPPTTSPEEFAQFWDPAVAAAGGKCFNMADEMVKYLDKSVNSKQVLIDAWKALANPSSGTRKKLVVKYFAEKIPTRPSDSEAKALWTSRGVPESSIHLLQREHSAATLVDKSDSATRAKLRAAGGQFAEDVHCTLDGKAATASSRQRWEQTEQRWEQRRQRREQTDEKEATESASSDRQMPNVFAIPPIPQIPQIPQIPAIPEIK